MHYNIIVTRGMKMMMTIPEIKKDHEERISELMSMLNSGRMNKKEFNKHLKAEKWNLSQALKFASKQ